MIDILLIFYQIKDKIAIFTNFDTHFLLIWDTYRFCRESRTNLPPSDPFPPYGEDRSPPMPKSVRLTLLSLVLYSSKGQTTFIKLVHVKLKKNQFEEMFSFLHLVAPGSTGKMNGPWKWFSKIDVQYLFRSRSQSVALLYKWQPTIN